MSLDSASSAPSAVYHSFLHAPARNSGGSGGGGAEARNSGTSSAADRAQVAVPLGSLPAAAELPGFAHSAGEFALIPDLADVQIGFT